MSTPDEKRLYYFYWSFDNNINNFFTVTGDRSSLGSIKKSSIK
jgi:hypothetical protein